MSSRASLIGFCNLYRSHLNQTYLCVVMGVVVFGSKQPPMLTKIYLMWPHGWAGVFKVLLMLLRVAFADFGHCWQHLGRLEHTTKVLPFSDIWMQTCCILYIGVQTNVNTYKINLEGLFNLSHYSAPLILRKAWSVTNAEGVRAWRQRRQMTL